MSENKKASGPAPSSPSSELQSAPVVVPEVALAKEAAFTTRLEDFVNWARKNSLWPLPFGTACCAIEYMSVVSSHYDVSRFGAEVVRFSPRQADCMLVLGTVVEKMGPVLRQIYDQMLEPKWVIAVGVCASSGGFYRAYHVLQGIDEILPVDVYVPGCPPTPEGIIYGMMRLQEKITKGGIVRGRDRYKIAKR